MKIEDGADAWELEDAAERERNAPDFCPLPPYGARAALRVGDQIELLFRFRGRDEHGPFLQSERLRVTVREVAPFGSGMVALDSPAVSSALLRVGDAVAFEPRHVFKIHLAASRRSCLRLEPKARLPSPP